MADPQHLPIKASPQGLASAVAGPRESLAGRGLAALRAGALPTLQPEADSLYHEARQIYDRYFPDEPRKWRQSAHAPELQQAFEIFQRLAAGGAGRAYYPLSQFYAGPETSGEAPKRAHFTKLAYAWCVDYQARNLPDVWKDLGGLYQWVRQDSTRALDCYQRAASQGYAPGQANLRWMYEQGRGVAQDDERAVFWFQQAVDQ